MTFFPRLLDAERARIVEHSMHRPEYEGDACGTGMVVR